MKVMLLILAVAAVTLAGCGRATEEKDRTYDVNGKVVSVDLAKKSIQLDHEDIPGLMKAMVMPFDVQDAKVLEGLKPGDEVQGKLKVRNGSYTLVELRKR